VIFNICPACRHVNPADATRCDACGVELRDEDDTVPGALRMEPRAPSPGALWLDDLMPPAPPQDPPEPEEPPLELTLREVEMPPAPPDSRFGRLLASEPAIEPVTSIREDGLVVSDPESINPAGAAIEVISGIRTLLDDDPASRAAAKAARRAAVRRARLGQSATALDAPQAVAEVLVLDPDDGARALLCTLLGAFGFRVHSAVALDQAAALSGARPFAAVFVDIVLDGSDGGAGVDLCKQVKLASTSGGEPPVLVLVSTQLRPVERVRAKLAGCDGMLVKPVTRGDVARTLEACGLSLPADARRA
jgi:CheY-like chemotaxis protein